MIKIQIKRKSLSIIGFAAMLVMVFAHSTMAQDVRYNFDKSADFDKFKTYKWVDHPSSEKLSDLVDRQFRAALDSELAKKGLTKVESDEANLYITYQAAIHQEKQYTSYNSGWGYGPGWRGYGGSGITTGQTETIHIGGLDVDMYDAAKKQLVWEGLVSKVIDPKAKPDKQQKNLAKAVAKLLKNYPPKKKS